MIHAEPHPLAGQTVRLNIRPSDGPAISPDGDPQTGDLYRIEDWFDRMAGVSWRNASGNHAAMNYGMRAGLAGLDPDDEVVYGGIDVGGMDLAGHIVHVSELGDVVSRDRIGSQQ